MSKVVFSVTEKQTKALQLLALDPGEVDLQWEPTFSQLKKRGLVEGDQRAWRLTRPGRHAVDLMASLPNGH